MKYLVLGAGGMAGHMITIFLSENGETVDGLARRDIPFCNTIKLDITDFEQLKTVIAQNQYDVIINCIGLLNQTAEDYKAQSVLVNSYLPHFLAEVTTNMKTRIFHMSTDCVF